MGNGPYTPIPAPLSAPVTSLERVAARPQRDVPNFPDRWTGGVTFLPEDRCGVLHVPVDPCAPSAGDLDLGVEPDLVQWEPYLVWDGATCTVRGMAMLEESAALARRRLASSRSAQMGRELWEGAAATAAGWDNRFFSDGTADVLTGASAAAATDGLACLRQYLSETLQGRRGMIHATAQTITHWSSLNLLRRDGDTIFDLSNNVVVQDGGYRGTGPNGEAAAAGSVWAYATGIVSVLIDDAGLTVDGIDHASVDRGINHFEVRAQQLALALWDGCALGAVELDIDPCVGGS